MNAVKQTSGMFGDQRLEIPSLDWYLKEMMSVAKFEARLIDNLEGAWCGWLNYEIYKGVVSPKRKDLVITNLEKLEHGDHRKILNDFLDIDPMPLCYEENHILGFDDFVRFAYFKAARRGADNFLGLDFSLNARSTSGICNGVAKVFELAAALLEHGLELLTQIVLINCEMLEPLWLKDLREEKGLITLTDWTDEKKKGMFFDGTNCLRCGLTTFRNEAKFCSACGLNINLQRKEGL